MLDFPDELLDLLRNLLLAVRILVNGVLLEEEVGRVLYRHRYLAYVGVPQHVDLELAPFLLQ